MRPPRLAHSWLALTVATSLLMTSSLMAQSTPYKITVEAGCPTAAGTCVEAIDKDLPSSDKQFSCTSGYVPSVLVHPSDLPEWSDIKAGTPPDYEIRQTTTLKAGCYSKCDVKYRKHKCPVGQETNNCDGADHSIETFCRTKPADTSIACDQLTSWEAEPCPTPTCSTPSYDTRAALNKLECTRANNKLLYLSKVPLDYAKCDPQNGWKGPNGEQLMVFPTAPVANLPKLRVKCHDFCSDAIVNAACAGPNKCTADPNNKKIYCKANSFLKIGEKFYKAKAAVCSIDGWKVVVLAPLVDFKRNPFEKIQPGLCEPCASMFENICPTCTENPEYTAEASKMALRCPANYYVTVDINGVEKPFVELTCSDAGWKDSTKEILKYATIVTKLEAKCHPNFVDTSCTAAPCSKPIYLGEGENLFCKNDDEQLVLNKIEVPEVKCDLAKGGWTNAQGTVPVSFSTQKIVKASCKRKTPPLTTVAPVTVAPTTVHPVTVAPVINVTDPPAAPSTGSSGSSTLFFLLIKKKLKKSGSEDEEESKTKTTKSSSKNNSAKNKKGKKGKKGGKKSEAKSKKGKKNKKEKEKSKKEKAAAIDSNVEEPEHQMSEANSTVPLTMALRPPSQNPNVMDI